MHERFRRAGQRAVDIGPELRHLDRVRQGNRDNAREGDRCGGQRGVGDRQGVLAIQLQADAVVLRAERHADFECRFEQGLEGEIYQLTAAGTALFGQLLQCLDEVYRLGQVVEAWPVGDLETTILAVAHTQRDIFRQKRRVIGQRGERAVDLHVALAVLAGHHADIDAERCLHEPQAASKPHRLLARDRGDGECRATSGAGRLRRGNGQDVDVDGIAQGDGSGDTVLGDLDVANHLEGGDQRQVKQRLDIETRLVGDAAGRRRGRQCARRDGAGERIQAQWLAGGRLAVVELAAGLEHDVDQRTGPHRFTDALVEHITDREGLVDFDTGHLRGGVLQVDVSGELGRPHLDGALYLKVLLCAGATIASEDAEHQVAERYAGHGPTEQCGDAGVRRSRLQAGGEGLVYIVGNQRTAKGIVVVEHRDAEVADDAQLPGRGELIVDFDVLKTEQAKQLDIGKRRCVERLLDCGASRAAAGKYGGQGERVTGACRGVVTDLHQAAEQFYVLEADRQPEPAGVIHGQRGFRHARGNRRLWKNAEQIRAAGRRTAAEMAEGEEACILYQ
ncbi:hypothetical protein [Pseudomonas sp. BIOMIG1BAC]|uniref:hypothetical protein n=1 Tax=Pseudomonas sp. BIOMIG1BAC TaxID=1758730 RepID=UPI001D13B00D|nr:hypothetical protein [Pseudomonas sp. BIOMIG1BAC]